MQEQTYSTPEYQADGHFIEQQWNIQGSSKEGWRLKRNNEDWLSFPSGYELKESICCGVCSTDLARKFLPYPLPQVIGHEVVVNHHDHPAVVEINASHQALGENIESCPWCRGGMSSQCPERITLGINQLPGGFSKYLLAPKNAVLPLPKEVNPELGTIIEPLAAAIQSLQVVTPRNDMKIAVLGPRRLGMLIIAALNAYRKKNNLQFEINALIRREKYIELAKSLGADTTSHPKNIADNSFDIVYDTTGNPEGFVEALRLSKDHVHLKSTHGQPVMGMHHLTDAVVDECSIISYHERALEFKWDFDESLRDNKNVYVSPSIDSVWLDKLKLKHPNKHFHQFNIEEAITMLNQLDTTWDSPFPQFDLAIVSNSTEIDQVLRPITNKEWSILRARGAILCIDNNSDDLAGQINQQNIRLSSSRCGDFKKAIELLVENSDIRICLSELFITNHFNLNEINQAFKIADDKEQSIKVVVHNKGNKP